MRITPINASNVKNSRIKKHIKVSGSKNLNENSYKSTNVFLGKDLVAFKGSEFTQTLRDNYFQLPKGANPDSFQIEAGKALLEGKDVLVEAPTGTGKTAIAHYAATNNMKKGKTTFYTTPLKALSNQKLNEFRAVYGDENVGILTGDRRENTEAPIIIMTTEVYRNMALSNMYGDESPLMQNLGTVIFDEFHYLGDPDRGPVWEESIMYTPKDVQTLELSATIGNPDELKNWIGGIKNENISLVSMPPEARHVPLTFDMISTQAYDKNEKFISKMIARGETPDIDRDDDYKPSKPKPSDFKEAVNMLSSENQLPAIFFIFSRKYSREILEYLSKEGPDLTTDEEKTQIENIVEKYSAKKYIGADLNTGALKKGYAIHNAGIIPGQKELIEELFQKKLIKSVISTETLAAGINMPAKTVVISSPYKPCDENSDSGYIADDEVLKDKLSDEEDGEASVRLLTSNEFKQMAGRAGRRGIDKAGYVYTMPTDRKTENEFLYLEVADCDPIDSNYNPDYAFLSGYYEHNADINGLEDIFDKSFYAYSKTFGQTDKKIDKLMEISRRKTDILLERGFLSEENGVIYPEFLAKMASKVRGYDALTLAETINSGVFKDISPMALAMIAGGIAVPSKSKETAINNQTNFSHVFEKARFSVKGVNDRLIAGVNSMLLKFGKSTDDFSGLEEMLAFAQSIEKPEASEDEIKSALKQLELKRAKMYKIIKTTGNYSTQDIVRLLKAGEVVPTKALETQLDAVDRFKKKINAKTIEDYIEKLQTELERLDGSSKGKKAQARIDRQRKELESDIFNAKNMLYLESAIGDALYENACFIKNNPPEIIRQNYNKTEKLYSKLTLKDDLIQKIKALQSIENASQEQEKLSSVPQNDEKVVNNSFRKLISTALDIYSTETNFGINASIPKYSLEAAQILYTWAALNMANPEDTMANWSQLLQILPKDKIDEGTIYRDIMQGADLLSQIAEMADEGIVWTGEEYYKNLKHSAIKARELLIKDPVTI